MNRDAVPAGSMRPAPRPISVPATATPGRCALERSGFHTAQGAGVPIVRRRGFNRRPRRRAQPHHRYHRRMEPRLLREHTSFGRARAGERHGLQYQRQRQYTSGRRRYAAALGTARRARNDADEIRLRQGALRRMHGTRRRSGDPVRCSPDRSARQRDDYDHRGDRPNSAGTRLQKAWLDREVVQYGSCQSGQIMSAARCSKAAFPAMRRLRPATSSSPVTHRRQCEMVVNVTYDKQITALLVIDRYNNFISERRKMSDRLKAGARTPAKNASRMLGGRGTADDL